MPTPPQTNQVAATTEKRDAVVDSSRQPIHIRRVLSRVKNETVTGVFARTLCFCRSVLWMLWVAFSFFFFPASPCQSQKVDRFADERYSCRFPFVWENVGDAGQFVDGIKPTRSGPRLMHAVELAPGQSTDFLLPPHEMLRAFCIDRDSILESDCELWLSDGSGLMRKLNTALSAKGKSLVAAPDYPKWTVARIRRSPKASGRVRFALFTSRRSNSQGVDAYRCEFPESNPVVIRPDDGEKPRRYSDMAAGQRIAVKFRGDSRVRFETRLLYDADTSMHRSYWMKVHVNGATRHIVSFDTLPERYSRWFVDGAEKLVGRREFAFLDFAADDEVEIEFSHRCFVRAEAVEARLCRSRANFDIVKNISEALARAYDPDKDRSTIIAADDTNAARSLTDQLDPWLDHERLLAVARDNTARQGGLNSYMWMRAIARQHHEDPDFRNGISIPDLASRIRGRYTLFRDLLPVAEQPVTPRLIKFPIRSIRRPGRKSSQTVVATHHVNESLSHLPDAIVFPVPATETGQRRLGYRLPENLGPSILRVVVDKANLHRAVNFQIQFDARPPVDFEVTAETDIHSRLLRPTYQESSLVAQGKRHFGGQPSTLDGPFSVGQWPTESSLAAVHEIVIPNGVREITLLAGSNCQHDCRFALQYMTSRHPRLSESEWTYLHSEKHNIDPLRRGVADDRLENNLAGLERLLQSHLHQFDASQPKPIARPEVESTPAEIDRLIPLAIKFAAEGNWIQAIETESRIVNGSAGHARNLALLRRASYLHKANEHFLASMELKGALDFFDDPLLRFEALQSLIENARRRPFSELLIEQFLTRGAVNAKQGSHVGNRESLRATLGETLIDHGKFAMGFFASPPKPDQTVTDHQARALFQMQWWGQFVELFPQMRPRTANLGYGLMLLRDGRPDTADTYLSEAGPLGQQWMQHWKDGVTIRNLLTSKSLEQRAAAIELWENWQETYPGNKVWLPLSGDVVRCRGAAHIYSPLRDTYGSFFVAGPRETAAIEIQGPTKIRIEMRPIHENDPDSRITDFVGITINGQTRIIPAIDNVPSKTLNAAGHPEIRPGTKLQTEIELSAGRHRIELESADHSFLFRTFQETPEVRLPVLPPLTRHTLAQVIAGRFGPSLLIKSNTRPKSGDFVRLIAPNHVSVRHHVGGLADPNGSPSAEQLWAQFAQQNQTLANTWHNRFHATDAGHRFTDREQWDFQAAELAMNAASNPDDAAVQLQAIAELHELHMQHPKSEHLQAILKSVKRGTTWQRMESFDQRAGIQSTDMEFWTAETPEVRIRKSLANMDSAKHVATSSKKVVVTVADSKPVHLRIKLRRPQIGHLPMALTTAVVEVDDDVRRITVDDQPRVGDVVLSPGEHRVKIFQENPFANHMIVVDLLEVLADGTEVPFVNPDSLLSKRTRSWMVALPDEPVKFAVRGPGLIRIDRYIDGNVTFETIPIPEQGTRSFTVAPAPGQPKALLRIFELKTGHTPAPVYVANPRTIPAEESWTEPVALASWEQPVNQAQQYGVSQIENLSLLPADIPLFSLTDLDDQQLGWQNIGTVGAWFAWRQRRALDELQSPLAQADRFFEAGLSRNFFDRWSGQYQQTQAFVRAREVGGTTFGLDHRSTSTLDDSQSDPRLSANGWGPWQSSWRTSLFAQDTGENSIPGFGSLPWSLSGSATFSRRQRINESVFHRTRIELFGRYLSEERNGLGPGELDQDIFTRYKADHRYGLRLSDLWVRQHCEDVRYWVRPQLVTNPDQLVPDNLGVHVGMDQLLGPIQLRLGYRLTGFFADNDRRNTAVQSLFDVDVMYERWHSRFLRSESRFAIRHDASGGGTSFQFNLRWYLNQGRGYRDFSPNSTLFRPIRQERALRQQMIFDP